MVVETIGIQMKLVQLSQNNARWDCHEVTKILYGCYSYSFLITAFSNHFVMFL